MRGLCRKCKVVLSEDNCPPCRVKSGRGLCRICSIEYQKIWASQLSKSKVAEISKRKSAHNRKRNTGASQEEFDLKLRLQSGRCEICSKPMIGRHGACQDHDHKTGEIRDLLCHKCNTMLGYACDDTEILANAIKYLQKHKSLFSRSTSKRGHIKAPTTRAPRALTFIGET
jgi:hypothetical protein